MIAKLRSHWDRLPKKDLERLQMRQFRHYLKTHVLPFNPHYRDSFAGAKIQVNELRAFADLQGIPFTTKSDLIATEDHPRRSRDFIIVPEPDVLARRPSTLIQSLIRGRKFVREKLGSEYRPVLLTSTAGRSAEPVPFLYSAHDIANLCRAGGRVMEIGGSEKDFRHLSTFPFAPHLAFWFAHYAGTAFGTFCISTGGGKVLGTDGNVRLVQKVCPDVIMGMPTFVYHLLKEVVARGIRLHNLRTIVLGGEKVADGMRRKLRQLAALLGSDETAVLATYAFTEAKMAWIECRPQSPDDPPSGYHLYPDFGIVEIIDPSSGKQVPDGEPGEIVFTPLDSRASVVLRYRTGDQISGGISYGACPVCGRLVPRLLGKISRVADIREMDLGKIKGTLVDFNELEHALDDLEHLGAWQIELRKADDDPMERDLIILHVESVSGLTPSEKELSDHLFAAAEIRPNKIKYHPVREMRNRLGIGRLLKEQKIEDNRPVPHRPSSQFVGPDQKTEKIRRADPALAANPNLT